MNEADKRMRAAIEKAVRAGIAAVGGVQGIRAMSMFPSASKQQNEIKKAA
jgi:hypothetical protein